MAKHQLRIDIIATGVTDADHVSGINHLTYKKFLTRLQDDLVIWSLQASELASIATSRPSIGPPICYIYPKNSTLEEQCFSERHFTAEELRALLLAGSGELEKVDP